MSSLSDRVARVPFWFHSIDLGNGLVTPGRKSQPLLQSELESLQLPALKGLSVLDVGAWDGFFSFSAERLGAERVVSLDHFVWREAMFGKHGYDLAHETLQSRAEVVNEDFMNVEFEAIGGPFDVVLFLGVLYHCRHPLLALERIAQATKTLAIIETDTIRMRGSKGRAYCEFYGGSEFGGDASNWWSPNIAAALALCRAAGFARAEVVADPMGTPIGLLGRALASRLSLKQSLSQAGTRIKGAINGVVHDRVVIHAYKQ